MNFLKKAISILMSAIVLVGVFAVGAVNVTEVRAAPIVYRGIDVSVHQGSIDFNKVKAAGYDFVIIRAGYGQVLSQKDTYFEQNVQQYLLFIYLKCCVYRFAAYCKEFFYM